MAEIASQDCCFPPIRRAKFAKDVRHMKFDGSHANEEPLRDLGITQSLSQELQDFPFPRGQALRVMRGGIALGTRES